MNKDLKAWCNLIVSLISFLLAFTLPVSFCMFLWSNDASAATATSLVWLYVIMNIIARW